MAYTQTHIILDLHLVHLDILCQNIGPGKCLRNMHVNEILESKVQIMTFLWFSSEESKDREEEKKNK